MVSLDLECPPRLSLERFAEAIRDNQAIESIDPSLIASLKLLPPGHLERLAYDSISEQATRIEDRWRSDGVLDKGETLSIDFAVSEFRVSGQMRRNALPGTQYLLHSSKWSAKTHLEFWIRHLLANAIEAQSSRVFSLRETESSIELPPIPEAIQLLEPLLECYRHGQNSPAPFYSQLSWDALKSLNDPKKTVDTSDPVSSLIETSRSLFEKSPQSTAFAPKYPWDVYARTCFGEGPVFDESFAKIALSIWTPYREALKLEGATC